LQPPKLQIAAWIIADDEYTRITPIGIAWITGRLYVVATGWSGGRYVVRSGLDTRLPLYPVIKLEDY